MTGVGRAILISIANIQKEIVLQSKGETKGYES